ncbi:Tm-1-like ATP-binding domain-containing protein [Opitutia bacterium ISCC 51]|nr:Tm-1-like ATP-binding domain-containing protein [Opitutae bacterium ISCC 51]QXD27155.1 Tm-1-like ATP-binding domain-containing protein [Opitutae bacterium ISCC 52]
MSTIAILGTLDSKADEHGFVAEHIRKRGHQILYIDVGTGSEPKIDPDYSRYEVASAIGLNLDELIKQQDRGACVSAMSKAAPAFVTKLVEEGNIDGIITLGGGGGTAIGTAAMRALPIGFPKVMVSTLASGNTAHYVGTKDIVMIPSVVDVNGLNRISRTIFTRAAGAICGMVETQLDGEGGKPLIVASMFGNTTTCVNIAKELLEEAGYEVLVFHATGTGGKAMESLIESGMIAGVLDITTTEWADEVVGGVLAAGPERMDAMSKANIPAVVVPGCVDMVNFGERDAVPEQFEGRNLYIHNPQITLMRTTPEECSQIGKIIAEKANANSAPVAILNPLKAVSEINGEGGTFYDPEADKSLFNAIRQHAQVEVIDIDDTINSATFSKTCAEKLLALLEKA